MRTTFSQCGALKACRRWTPLGALAVVMVVGCAGAEKLPPSIASMTPRRAPNRITTLVTSRPVEANGRPASQGMLCRVYFFRDEDPTPIRVRGKVIFTAYDLSRTDRKNEPVGVYEIASEELDSHERKDILGPSYIFWLPYNPAEKAQVSLQAKIQPSSGEVVCSQPVSVEVEPLIADDGSAKPEPSQLAEAYARKQVTVIDPYIQKASASEVQTIWRPGASTAGDRAQ